MGWLVGGTDDGSLFDGARSLGGRRDGILLCGDVAQRYGGNSGNIPVEEGAVG